MSFESGRSIGLKREMTASLQKQSKIIIGAALRLRESWYKPAEGNSEAAACCWKPIYAENDIYSTESSQSPCSFTSIAEAQYEGRAAAIYILTSKSNEI